MIVLPIEGECRPLAEIHPARVTGRPGGEVVLRLQTLAIHAGRDVVLTEVESDAVRFVQRWPARVLLVEGVRHETNSPLVAVA